MPSSEVNDSGMSTGCEREKDGRRVDEGPWAGVTWTEPGMLPLHLNVPSSHLTNDHNVAPATFTGLFLEIFHGWL